VLLHSIRLTAIPNAGPAAFSIAIPRDDITFQVSIETVSVDLTGTPEPGTMLLLLAGALSGLAIRAMLAGKVY